MSTSEWLPRNDSVKPSGEMPWSKIAALNSHLSGNTLQILHVCPHVL